MRPTDKAPAIHGVSGLLSKIRLGHRRVLVAVACVFALLLVAGCIGNGDQDGDEPGPQPSESGYTPSPTGTMLDVSDEATADVSLQRQAEFVAVVVEFIDHAAAGRCQAAWAMVEPRMQSEPQYQERHGDDFCDNWLTNIGRLDLTRSYVEVSGVSGVESARIVFIDQASASISVRTGANGRPQISSLPDRLGTNPDELGLEPSGDSTAALG